MNTAMSKPAACKGTHARKRFTPFRSHQGRPTQPALRGAAAVSSSAREAVPPTAAQPAEQQACSRRVCLQQQVVAVAAAAGLLGSWQAVAAPSAAAATACELQKADSGLQYCDLREGEGDVPGRGSLIRCHYTGRLAANGRVFDSSYERGRPLTFKVGVGEVIRGWDEGILGGPGIPGMKTGGKRRLLIPAELAYGDRSVGGGIIPANSVLEFEVELLGKRSR